MHFLSGILGRMMLLLLHVDVASAFPPALSKEEEQACLEGLKHGERWAREKLISHNLRLVAHMTKKFYSPDREQEELISVGTLGLMKAVDSFDPDKGARFATYAARCIENEILMQYRAKRKQAGEVFFDEPLEYDKDGNALTLKDFISDDVDLEEEVAQTMQQRQLYDYLQQKLTARERTVIARRYGLLGYLPQTQREVADAMGISRSYVSRIEKRALLQLRKAYASIGVYEP